MQRRPDNRDYIQKHPLPFIIAGLILIAIIGLSVFTNSSETKSSIKESSSVNHKKSSSSEEESSSSSEEESSSSSSETESSSSQVSDSDSIKELKAVITTPMTKENFLNIEQGVLDSAQYNDIDSPNQSQATQFKSRLSNINTLISNNNNLADSESEHLTDKDFSTLKSYQTKLIDYLNALHDYATTYQTDNPVIQKSDTSEDTKTEFQDELNESKQTFETSKNDWLNSYDSIMNQ